MLNDMCGANILTSCKMHLYNSSFPLEWSNFRLMKNPPRCLKIQLKNGILKLSENTKYSFDIWMIVKLLIMVVQDPFS